MSGASGVSPGKLTSARKGFPASLFPAGGAAFCRAYFLSLRKPQKTKRWTSSAPMPFFSAQPARPDKSPKPSQPESGIPTYASTTCCCRLQKKPLQSRPAKQPSSSCPSTPAAYHNRPRKHWNRYTVKRRPPSSPASTATATTTTPCANCATESRNKASRSSRPGFSSPSTPSSPA